MLVYIGLGSNLENPKVQIEKALSALNLSNEVTVNEVSSFYESKPLLDMPGPNYINAVCSIKTSLDAIDLLDVCQGIENDQKRVREVKWGSRTIDLDILLYGQQVISCLLYTSPSPRDRTRSRMPSSA